MSKDARLQSIIIGKEVIAHGQLPGYGNLYYVVQYFTYYAIQAAFAGIIGSGFTGRCRVLEHYQFF